MSVPALSCRNISTGYGNLTVVRGFNLDAERGSVVAVLGPNGAGKTTLMLALAGLLPRSGEVLINGEPLVGGRPRAASRAGVVLVPDDRSLFTSLSVRENIAAAAAKGSATDDEVQSLFPGLISRWKTRAAALSGGEQQMLAMARGLVQRPKILLVDEMSMGLAPITVENLLPVVRTLADTTGAVVILVEQHVQLALEVADQVVVLVHGQIALSGPAAELAGNPDRLESAYLGIVAND
jgi:branched-chain amino acid transport system ATP-binding protein